MQAESSVSTLHVGRPLHHQWSRLLAAGRWVLHVNEPDPVQAILNQGVALSVCAIMALVLVLIPVYIAQGLPPGAIAATLLAPLMLIGVWLANRRGGITGALLLSAMTLLVNSASYAPATYLNVAGYSVTHVGFIFPVVVATFFASPLWGGIFCLLQAAALAGVGLAAGYNFNEVRWFFANSSTSMLTVYVFMAVAAVIFRRAVRQAAILNASLELKVQERTAQLERAHNQRIETMLTVSHDSRNRLQTQMGDLWELREALEQKRGEDVLALVDAVEFVTYGLAGAMSDLKESAMASSGQLTLVPEPTDVVALTRTLLTEFEGAFKREGMQLSLTVAPDVPLAYVDGKRIDRVFLNILGNAFKFTRRHGNRVSISISAEDGGLLWTCTDEGRGMDAATLQRLGELFFCAERGEDAPDGTGIGLYFSIQMVQQNGGRISFHSEGIGRGSTVAIWLPKEG